MCKASAESETSGAVCWKIKGYKENCAPPEKRVQAVKLPEAGQMHLEKLVRKYISKGVQRRIDAGLGGWLGELRFSSVLFPSLSLSLSLSFSHSFYIYISIYLFLCLTLFLSLSISLSLSLFIPITPTLSSIFLTSF